MFEILDEIVQKQQRYDATSARHDVKVGGDRATMSDPGMARIALDQTVGEAFREAALDAAKYNQAAADVRGRINAAVERHQNRLSQELYVERTNAENAHQLNVAQLDAELGDGSRARAALVEKAHAKAEGLAAVRARVTPRRRPLRVHWRTAYLPLMIVIALLEMPLNQLSFLLFFRGAPAFSWLLALAVGAVLVFFAHLAGVWLRQLNLDKRGPIAGTLAVLRVVGVVGIALGVIYIVAALRQRYVNFTNAPDPSLADGVLASQNALDQVTSVIAAAAVDTTLSLIGWLVFGLNFAFFAFGTLLAFRRHDPDPDYERATREDEAASKTLRQHQAQYTSQKARLDDRYATETGYLNEEIADAETRLDESRALLTQLEDRRAPDIMVIAQCALVRAEHRVNSFYAKIAARGLTLPAYALPDVQSVLAQLEGQASAASQTTSFSAQPFSTTGRRPPRPTGPGDRASSLPEEPLQ